MSDISTDMDDPLAGIFDACVLGTGFVPSVLAGALARAGQRVLHIDANDYYGDEHANFTLTSLVAEIDKHRNGRAAGTSQVHFHAVPDVVEQDVAPAASIASSCEALPSDSAVPAELASFSRRITLDLLPSLTLARGLCVQVLVQSGVASYVDFKSLAAAFMLQAAPTGRGLEPVQLPCRKADVFASPTLSLLDKRRLMKFLQFAMDFNTEQVQNTAALTLNDRILGTGRSLLRPQNKSREDVAFDEHRSRAFTAFLSHFDLPPSQHAMLMHAFACIPSDVTDSAGTPVRTDEGMLALVRVLHAMGRFGATPYILPMYGAGEVVQAFTRVCAVNGGIYMLDTVPTGYVHYADEGVHSLSVGGRTVRARRMIGSPAYAHALVNTRVEASRILACAVCITRAPLAYFTSSLHERTAGAGVGAGLCTGVIPPHALREGSDNASCIFILQQSEANAVIRAPYHVVHVWSSYTVRELCGTDLERVRLPSSEAIEARAAAAARIRSVVQHLVQPEAAAASSCVWHTVFTAPADASVATSPPAGWTLYSWNGGAQIPLHSEEMVQEAAGAFAELCPGRVFMDKDEASTSADADAVAAVDTSTEPAVDTPVEASVSALPPAGVTPAPVPADGEAFNVDAALELLADSDMF